MAEVVTCNCVEEMDKLLAPKNTKLQVTMGFPRDGRKAYALPCIRVEKIEPRKRVGPAIAIPSFCPFCGVAYNHKTKDKADG